MSTHVEFEPEVLTALNAGRKIDAIKALRSLRGIGLKEAKELIDSYADAHKSEGKPIEVTESNFSVAKLLFVGLIIYLVYKFFNS
ncbi:ribosomal protein L7/L12 [Neptunomonas japonica]|uniref:ribosomal protein L7/L12 n=1 Tax=Neptunomonas japonica TaxID=417574 RepID=UPI0004118FD5|nr:ribosomal protein L7/L12 [Neptunomonas japonica]